VPDDRHARIENPTPDLDNWEATYVSFSGFFGNYGPHMFKAAPVMHSALKKLERLVMREGDAEQVALLVAALKEANGGKG
jgi:hypothetical protein